MRRVSFDSFALNDNELEGDLPTLAGVALPAPRAGPAGGKLPLFDLDGQAVAAAIVRRCLDRGWAEPWFNNPLKPDWLVCKLTEQAGVWWRRRNDPRDRRRCDQQQRRRAGTVRRAASGAATRRSPRYLARYVVSLAEATGRYFAIGDAGRLVSLCDEGGFVDVETHTQMHWPP